MSVDTNAEIIKAPEGTFQRVSRLQDSPLGSSRSKWYIYSGIESSTDGSREEWPRTVLVQLRERGGRLIDSQFSITPDETVYGLAAHEWAVNDRNKRELEPPTLEDLLKEIAAAEKRQPTLKHPFSARNAQ